MGKPHLNFILVDNQTSVQEDAGLIVRLPKLCLITFQTVKQFAKCKGN